MGQDYLALRVQTTTVFSKIIYGNSICLDVKMATFCDCEIVQDPPSMLFTKAPSHVLLVSQAPTV